MNQQDSEEYNAAVGSVMDARKKYEAACAVYGVDSVVAGQDKERLDREIEHRAKMRVRHDEARGNQ